MKKKKAIILSYINMALNFPINLFLMPMLIDSLTDNYYSIYRIVQSFAGPLILFSLGVSTIVAREIVSCKSDEGADRIKQNSIALSMLASSFMAVIVLLVSLCMCTAIPSIYGQNYSPEDIKIGQIVYIIFTISIIFHILTDSFTGIILGHQGFTFHSVIGLTKTILKAILIVAFLSLGYGVIAVASVDLILSLIAFIMSTFYSFVVAKERPKLYYWDKKKIIEIFSYAFAILLQSIVTQINNSVDTMVLGAVEKEKYIITMYSCALTIYSIYNSLVSIISNYFLPDAIRLAKNNATGKELTDFVIRPGRFQAMLAIAILSIFSINGSQFITLWVGPKYGDAFFVTLILIVPVTIPLVENVAISILDATLKRKYRSYTLAGMALFNFILTVVLVKRIGFYGAAIATALSLIIGHGLLMNLYYKKEYKMEIKRLFLSIFHKTLLCGVFSSLVLILVNKLGFWGMITNGWIVFILRCSLQFLIYILLLYTWGMNDNERSIISGFTNHFVRNK